MSKLNQLLEESKYTVDYKTTEDDFHITYEIINAEIFKNSLPKNPQIKIMSMPKYRALYVNKNYVFDSRFETKTLFINIVFHEMIHCWQHENNHNVAHGPSFYKWKPVVESYGLKLSRNL